jgi:hypothetical protein
MNQKLTFFNPWDLDRSETDHSPRIVHLGGMSAVIPCHIVAHLDIHMMAGMAGITIHHTNRQVSHEYDPLTIIDHFKDMNWPSCFVNAIYSLQIETLERESLESQFFIIDSHGYFDEPKDKFIFQEKQKKFYQELNKKHSKRGLR